MQHPTGHGACMSIMTSTEKYSGFQLGEGSRGWKSVVARATAKSSRGYGAALGKLLLFLLGKPSCNNTKKFFYNWLQAIFTPTPPCKIFFHQIYTDLKNYQIWSLRGWFQPTGWEIGTLIFLPKHVFCLFGYLAHFYWPISDSLQYSLIFRGGISAGYTSDTVLGTMYSGLLLPCLHRVGHLIQNLLWTLFWFAKNYTFSKTNACGKSSRNVPPSRSDSPGLN